MQKWRLREMTYNDVRKQRFEVAVLPIGSCEPHNLHLPYGCDTIHGELLADKICAEAARKGAKVALLPAIPYGVNTNTLEFPMTISINPSTGCAILKDIVQSVEHHGLRKMILFNSHGGNDFLKPFIREVYGKTKVRLFLVNWWTVADDVKDAVFSAPGEHGDEMETSVAMELFPELVRFEDADEGATRRSRFEALDKGWVIIARPWNLATINSGYGNPRNSSREKGKKFIDAVVSRLAAFVKELSDAEVDDTFPYIVARQSDS